MQHILITIEGAHGSPAREVARALSLRLGVPLVAVESLQAAAVYRKTPKELALSGQESGKLGFMASLIGIGAAQGGFLFSSSLRQREKKLAAKLLRKSPLILTGETLNAFCSTGLRKYEAYLHAGRDGALKTPVQYPKEQHPGMGYDITLDTDLLNVDQCAEWIEKAISEAKP